MMRGLIVAILLLGATNAFAEKKITLVKDGKACFRIVTADTLSPHGGFGAKDLAEFTKKVTGATVHFVNEIMDNGPVIIQAAVPVKDGEDEEALLTRIHAMEHRIYPQAVQWLATGRLSLNGRRVALASATIAKAPAPEAALIWPPLEAGF